MRSGFWAGSLLLLLGGCLGRPARDWGDFNMLRDPVLPPELRLRGKELSREDYLELRKLGEMWFREGAFGNERSISDVMGIFQAKIEVPCEDASKPNCREERILLPDVLAAVDRLDGVEGNLFQGNGGPKGNGYTSDLVVRFPKGTTMSGVPVPEELHTGLDVEAGEVLPIGIALVPATKEDAADKPYLPELDIYGYADAPPGKVRFRLACAACHYSLDVDNDGKADLRSAKIENPTEGSLYQPRDAWGVGNQDISFGWLFSFSANPILGAMVLSGALGEPGAEPSLEYLAWLKENYKKDEVGTTREVIAGMLAQPRGYADVTTDTIYNPIQIPPLYTRHNWPSNSEGGQSNGSDRNNTVWTGALDFTGLIDLCSDRGGAVHLPWEPISVFNELSCDDFADLMTRYAPATKYDPKLQQGLIDDILGVSDGVPGMLDANSMVVMQTTTIPKEIVESPVNVNAHRIRTAADYGGDAKFRGAGMAALGFRIGIEPKWRETLKVYADKYGLPLEDLQNEAVSLALDWFDPPANNTPLLTASVSMVEQGYTVFKENGCESCHRGPFSADNIVHPLSDDPRVEFGGPRAPSSAGWRVLNRGAGPSIDTEPQRAINGRPLRRLISPPYDPVTGVASSQGGVLQGLMSVQRVGYKSTTLRYLWGSAPFLHDGGVGMALKPGTEEGTDLKALLHRAGSDSVIYGMGTILTLAERSMNMTPKANAALSLQALVLESERDRVVEANQQASYEVPAGSQKNPIGGGPPVLKVSVASMGIVGTGHDFYVDDTPGGDQVSALVAYLLALDDCPRQLPGKGEPCFPQGY